MQLKAATAAQKTLGHYHVGSINQTATGTSTYNRFAVEQGRRWEGETPVGGLWKRSWGKETCPRESKTPPSVNWICIRASPNLLCERGTVHVRGSGKRGPGAVSAFMGISWCVVHFMAILLLINFSVFALCFSLALSPRWSRRRALLDAPGLSGMLLMAPPPSCYCCCPLIWLLRLWILIIVHDLEDFPHVFGISSFRSFTETRLVPPRRIHNFYGHFSVFFSSLDFFYILFFSIFFVAQLLFDANQIGRS